MGSLFRLKWIIFLHLQTLQSIVDQEMVMSLLSKICRLTLVFRCHLYWKGSFQMTHLSIWWNVKTYHTSVSKLTKIVWHRAAGEVLRELSHFSMTTYHNNPEYLGPVVQSVVSLTSSLRVISLTVLADSIYNNLIFFANKMWVAFALHNFQQKKFQHNCVSLDVNFNEVN